MLQRNQFFVFIVSFLSVGFLFLSLPEKGFSGLAQPGPECCQFAPDQCSDLVEGGPACLVEDVVPGVCNESTGLCEASSQTTAIPALGEWGLAAVVLALGITGLIVYRRRRSPA